MSELSDLVSNIVRKELNKFDLTKTIPCKVIQILENGKLEVELISNKAHYRVFNYSGSPVNIGETVQLFYKGIISESSAYIGAALFKNGNSVNCLDEVEKLIDDINGEHIWNTIDEINGEVIL